MSGERALITGITGQDGSFLAEYLLGEGYTIGGFLRSSSTGHLGNVNHLRGEIEFFRGSLDDEVSIETAVSQFKPDEIYNLGAEAAPADSFKRSVYTSDINALGPLRIFEAALRLRRSADKNVKVYQASTSEMFGKPPVVPQTETTPMKPNNPYGVAKLFAHLQARILREGEEGLDVRCGILFNHESDRRGMQYVTRKVSVGVACIKSGVRDIPLNEHGRPILNENRKLTMGNLDAVRDWGYAKEYVQAMYKIMRQPNPDDFIVATGKMHSVQELLEHAFGHVGLDWRDHVLTSPEFKRPLETGPLCGDASKAKTVLDWEPKMEFKDLVGYMVDCDLARFS
jgi:GDPmannose 4,6-dehydratase